MRKIIVHPDICNGRPTIDGTRIAVQTVLEFLSAGDSIDNLLADYPTLTRDDVLACLTYAGAILEPIRLSNPTVDFDLTRERDPWA